jgi:hypothetical protein
VARDMRQLGESLDEATMGEILSLEKALFGL